MKVQTNLKSGTTLQDLSVRMQPAGSRAGQFLANANREAARVMKNSAYFVSTVTSCLAGSLNRPY